MNRSADALEASTDAVASWRAAGDRQSLALALCRRARVLERVPDPDAALAAVRSAFALLEGSGDTPALARAHATLVWLVPEARRTTAVRRRGARGLPSGRAGR